MTINVHAIQTGTVQIKANHVRRADNNYPSLANLLFSAEWSDWLPIYAWVIEHPEGLFVVDTGDTARTGEQGYLPRMHPFYRSAVRFRIAPTEEIGPQMARRGWEAKTVTAVILTHLHTDHVGGVHHFPHSDILLHPAEYAAAKGMGGRLNGYLPHRWPRWLRPQPIPLTATPFGPFPQSYPVTQDGRIMVVPTPGHTPAHISVIVQADDVTYFLAGDTSYRQDLMLAGVSDGISTPQTFTTLRQIQAFVQDRPTVYLPSHDPEAAARLANKQVIPRPTIPAAMLPDHPAYSPLQP